MSKPKKKEEKLQFIVTHLGDEDVSEVDDGIRRRLAEIVRKRFRNLFKELSPFVKDLPKLKHVANRLLTNSHKSPDDDLLVHLNGELSLSVMNKQNVEKLLIYLCEAEMPRTQLAIDAKVLTNFFKHEKPLAYQMFHYDWFKLGSLVNQTYFVNHLDSLDYKYAGDDRKPLVAIGPYWSAIRMSQTSNDQQIEFFHNQRKLTLWFRLFSDRNGLSRTGLRRELTSQRYKLDVNYNQVIKCVVKCHWSKITPNDNKPKKFATLYLVLKNPALLSVDINDSEVQEKERTVEDVHCDEVAANHSWVRVDKIPGVGADVFGLSNVIAVQFRMINDEEKVNYRFNKRMDPLILLTDLIKYSRIPIWFADVTNQKISDFGKVNLEPNTIRSQFFNVYYAYQAVFCYKFEAQDQLLISQQLSKFQKKVIEMTKLNPKAAESALFAVAKSMSDGSIVRLLPLLVKQFEYKKAHPEVDFRWSAVEVKDVRRVILTPGRRILLPPQPTLLSRFLLCSDPDYTLRLSIREETIKGLVNSLGSPGAREYKLKFIRLGINKMILAGLLIAGRTFEFLGSSSSQLRESGMTLYAADPKGNTAKSIRDAIGNFDEAILRNVPKYVARTGLAFSQALYHITIDKNSVKIVTDASDIKTTNKDKVTYIFSDGVGRMSTALAEMIFSRLPMSVGNGQRRPSAAQIRFRGCKGMIVEDPTLEGLQLILRKSQRKFEVDCDKLGVLKISAPRPVYLNRPLITILECLKVAPEIFLEMLHRELKGLANAILNESQALRLISRNARLPISCKLLTDCKLPILKEPFFRRLLDSLVSFNTKMMKTKARIQIPMDQARTVFGVLDETRTLKYGQVFVQISKVEGLDGRTPLKDDYQILTGEVMVTKFPCMHPGDIRKLKAVDVPKLHHIRDCIVFPAEGPRPHPDEMAGSDLDGDEYAVFWGEDNPLIFKNKPYDPMDFPSSQAELLDHDCQLEDILEFFARYMMEDNIGIIAHAHLAIADRYGIMNRECETLARKYSKALDFAKTGAVEEIEWNERPKEYPDFMGKLNHRKTYYSEKALGQMFRKCEMFEESLNDGCKIWSFDGMPNAAFSIDGWEKYRDSAKEAFEIYEARISKLLARFGVQNEVQLLSGTFTHAGCFEIREPEYSDVNQIIDQLVRGLFFDMKKLFCKQIINASPEEVNRRAAAWYMVTVEINKMSSLGLHGLPWTITEYLCQMWKSYVKNTSNDAIQRKTQLIKDSIDYVEEMESCNEMIEKLVEKLNNEVNDILESWAKAQLQLMKKTDKEDIKNWLNLIKPILVEKRKKLEDKKRQNLSDDLAWSKTELVIKVMKTLVKKWLKVDINNPSILKNEFDKIQLGFLAFQTLNKLVKTATQVENIKKLASVWPTSYNMCCETIYIHLPKPKNNDEETQFSDVFNRNQMKIVNFFKKTSGVQEAILELHQRQGVKHRYYYLLTVVGTIWQLLVIRKIITDKNFYRDVVKAKDRWVEL